MGFGRDWHPHRSLVERQRGPDMAGHMTRRGALALLFVGALQTHAYGQAAPQSARVEQINILAAGRFEKGPANTLQIVERTNRIPGSVGVSFGMIYTIIGPASALPASLNLVIRLPQRGGMANPTTGTRIFRIEEPILGRIGATNTSGFTFDHQWEIVLGSWTMEIWSSGRKLGEQQFEIVRP